MKVSIAYTTTRSRATIARRHHAALEIDDVHAVQDFEIGDLRPGNSLLGGRHELAGDRPVDPADDPQGQHADHEPEQGDSGLAQQRSHPARLGGLFERDLQAGNDLGGDALDRLP